MIKIYMKPYLIIWLMILFITNQYVYAQCSKVKKYDTVNISKYYGGLNKMIRSGNNRLVLINLYGGTLLSYDLESKKVTRVDTLSGDVSSGNLNSETMFIPQNIKDSSVFYNGKSTNTRNAMAKDSNVESVVSFSRAGETFFATGLKNGFLNITNASGILVRSIETNLPVIHDIVSWEDKKLIICSSGRKLGLLDLTTMSYEEISSDREFYDVDFWQIEIVNDSMFINMGFDQIYLFLNSSVIQEKNFRRNELFPSFSFNRDHNLLAVCDHSSISLYNINTWKLLCSVDISKEIAEHKSDQLQILTLGDYIVLHVFPYQLIIYKMYR
jgi:hypothetical protein